MKIQRAYKVELDPNNAQKTALRGACGAARWIYNWGLERKIEAFKANGAIPRATTLNKELRVQRAEVAPWLTQYASLLIDDTLQHCDAAFDNYFTDLKDGTATKVKKARAVRTDRIPPSAKQIEMLQHLPCFPKFKKKSDGICSARFHTDYKVELCQIRLPRIGIIRLKESGYVPTSGTEGTKFYGVAVSERAGRWFVSVNVEIEAPEPPIATTNIVGADFGIKTLATCSDGKTFENPKALKTNLRKLKHLQRTVSRRLKGSANRAKTQVKVNRLHARITNIRANTLHNLSSHLTRTKSGVVIEDLNVAGMMKNRYLAQAIGDCGFGELRRQIVYKGEWYGCDVQFADQWFASSKTCSVCGTVKADLTLKQRTWACAHCGSRHDRDLNAARNLAALYQPQQKLAEATTDNSNACGGEVSGNATSVAALVFSGEAGTEQSLSPAASVSELRMDRVGATDCRI